MEQSITRLYLVRHCRSVGNQRSVFQGQTDFDVSEDGAKQLALLGLRFRNVHIDTLYSSPLIRAYKTAEAINAYHRLPIITKEDLKEICAGEIEGKPLETFVSRYPALAENWNTAPHVCAFPGGESTQAVCIRAKRVLDGIISENRGKTVVVTGHGFFLRCAVCVLLNQPIEALKNVKLGGNTSVSEFEIAEDGTVSVVRMSDLSHLPEELVGDLHQYDLKV